MNNHSRLLVIIVTACLPLVAFTQNAKQYYKTGLTFVEAGNYQDAIDQFTKALDLEPEYTQAYVERARSYEAYDDLKNAADDLKRALVFEQKEPELYYDAARVNFSLERYKDALQLVTQSTELDRKSEASFRLLARIQLALEDYSNALVSINKALTLKDNPENNFYRGQISEKMKKLYPGGNRLYEGDLKKPTVCRSLPGTGRAQTSDG